MILYNFPADLAHRAILHHTLKDALHCQFLRFTVASRANHCLHLRYKFLQYVIGFLLILPSALNFCIFALDSLVIVLEVLVLQQSFLNRELVQLEDHFELLCDLRLLLLHKLLFLLFLLRNRHNHLFGAVNAGLAGQVK